MGKGEQHDPFCRALFWGDVERIFLKTGRASLLICSMTMPHALSSPRISHRHRRHTALASSTQTTTPARHLIEAAASGTLVFEHQANSILKALSLGQRLYLLWPSALTMANLPTQLPLTFLAQACQILCEQPEASLVLEFEPGTPLDERSFLLLTSHLSSSNRPVPFPRLLVPFLGEEAAFHLGLRHHQVGRLLHQVLRLEEAGFPVELLRVAVPKFPGQTDDWNHALGQARSLVPDRAESLTKPVVLPRKSHHPRPRTTAKSRTHITTPRPNSSADSCAS